MLSLPSGTSGEIFAIRPQSVINQSPAFGMTSNNKESSVLTDKLVNTKDLVQPVPVKPVVAAPE
jgi:hypothetical protein